MSKATPRARTADRGPPEGFVPIHTVEQLGPNMSRLPNGSLLCANVPIARTGWMVYGPDEVPIEPGPDGHVYVERTAETLFCPECIGSFMASPVVDEHPDDDVTPDNWKELAHGFSTTNVRQGTGADSDVLLADLIISNKELIESILSGKREISLGYDADYTQTAPGVGRQTNILGNHIALVEKGRCGPRCAIGDQEYQPQLEKEKAMPTPTKRVRVVTGGAKRVTLDSLRQKVKDAEAELEAAQETMDEDMGAGGDTHIHIHAGGDPNAPTMSTTNAADEGDPDEDPYEPRFKAIEDGMTKMMDSIAALTDAVGKASQVTQPAADALEPEDMETMDAEMSEEDKAALAKTKDSAPLEAGYKAVLAQAEILVPGFRMPTFDATAKRKATIDSMCQARRRCLDAVMVTADGIELVQSVNAGKAPDLAKMDCVGVANLFRSASGAKALLNRTAATKDSGTAVKVDATPHIDIDAINKANREFWAGKTA